MLQLLQAMPGNRCAPRHGSFLKPGGSLCNDFKLVARTARAEPRKCTEKLLKGVGGCAVADTEKRAPDIPTPGLPLEARDCLLVIFFPLGPFWRDFECLKFILVESRVKGTQRTLS